MRRPERTERGGGEPGRGGAKRMRDAGALKHDAGKLARSDGDAGSLNAPAIPDARLRTLLLDELAHGPGYGYGLARAIEQRRGGSLTKQPEVLYPVLHKLEADGMAAGAWEQGENGRPRRTYTITPKGRRQADKLAKARERGQALPGTLATEQGEAKR